jgi:hypothetical protein
VIAGCHNVDIPHQEYSTDKFRYVSGGYLVGHHFINSKGKVQESILLIMSPTLYLRPTYHMYSTYLGRQRNRY